MDQQFSLSWNNFHGNLTKGFAGLLGKGEFVDVTIAVEGHLLQAHKVILSICSPYFKKMFQLNPCQHPIVVLRDVSHKAMLALLQFMYHGEVSVQRHELTAFISTAEVLQVKGLTNKETEEEREKEPESNPAQVSRNENESQSTTPNTPLSCVSQPQDTIHNETAPNESDLTKQREFIEKLQRLSNLKRKSEEYLQKNYYSDLSCVDKRPKTVDNIVHPKPMHQLLSANTYEALKNLYDDLPLNITKGYNTLQRLNSKDMDDKCIDRIPDIELKTECEEDSVTDPVVCTTPKHYDGSREKELQLPLDYQTPRDNCTGLNSLFLDLKNLVNGKMGNVPVPNTLEEYSRQNLEHRLITIPQKEDGKKKYPQRSCRLCWKLGKRRDTRFMCNACDMPFCKTPCFEVHYNDIVKLPQFQGDYYAT